MTAISRMWSTLSHEPNFHLLVLFSEKCVPFEPFSYRYLHMRFIPTDGRTVYCCYSNQSYSPFRHQISWRLGS